MQRAVRTGLLLAALVAANLLAQEQSDFTPPNSLFQQAGVESERASKLERRGKKEAVDAYELAGELSEASIVEAERTGIREEDRPLEAYFRCASSYLHAGRLLSQRKGDDMDEVRRDELLRKAELYLDQVEKIEADRARRANAPINPEIWRVHNAAGYVAFSVASLRRRGSTTAPSSR